jgi:hypothetical protein
MYYLVYKPTFKTGALPGSVPTKWHNVSMNRGDGYRIGLNYVTSRKFRRLLTSYLHNVSPIILLLYAFVACAQKFTLVR